MLLLYSTDLCYLLYIINNKFSFHEIWDQIRDLESKQSRNPRILEIVFNDLELCSLYSSLQNSSMFNSIFHLLIYPSLCFAQCQSNKMEQDCKFFFKKFGIYVHSYNCTQNKIEWVSGTHITHIISLIKTNYFFFENIKNNYKDVFIISAYFYVYECVILALKNLVNKMG